MVFLNRRITNMTGRKETELQEITLLGNQNT